ncbi:DUF6053 domain-containing protein [Lysobacter enzymogenes]
MGEPSGPTLCARIAMIWAHSVGPEGPPSHPMHRGRQASPQVQR